jgi:hypothetical protein
MYGNVRFDQSLACILAKCALATTFLETRAPCDCFAALPLHTLLTACTSRPFSLTSYALSILQLERLRVKLHAAIWRKQRLSVLGNSHAGLLRLYDTRCGRRQDMAAFIDASVTSCAPCSLRCAVQRRRAGQQRRFEVAATPATVSFVRYHRNAELASPQQV